MGIQRFSSASPSVRQRVMITTVDPTNHNIQAIMQDGTPIPIVVWEIGTTFRWPVEGELWTVYQEQGQWKLDKPVEGTVSNLNPGDTHLNTGTGVVSVGGPAQSAQVAVDQTTGNVSITNSADQATSFELTQDLTFSVSSPTTITATASGITLVSGSNTFFLDGTKKITINGTTIDLTKLVLPIAYKANGTFTTGGTYNDTWNHNLNASVFYSVFVTPIPPTSGTSHVAYKGFTVVDANNLQINWDHDWDTPQAGATVHVYAIY